MQMVANVFITHTDLVLQKAGKARVGDSRPDPLKMLRRMLAQNGVTEDALCLRFSVNRLEDLGMGQVNDAIKFAQGASE